MCGTGLLSPASREPVALRFVVIINRLQGLAISPGTSPCAPKQALTQPTLTPVLQKQGTQQCKNIPELFFSFF